MKYTSFCTRCGRGSCYYVSVNVISHYCIYYSTFGGVFQCGKLPQKPLSYVDGDGLQDGLSDGLLEVDGLTEGLSDGLTEGLLDGLSEGLTDGLSEGLIEGLLDGLSEGLLDGLSEGLTDGLEDGLADGLLEGLFDVDGDVEVLIEAEGL